MNAHDVDKLVVKVNGQLRGAVAVGRGAAGNSVFELGASADGLK